MTRDSDISTQAESCEEASPSIAKMNQEEDKAVGIVGIALGASLLAFGFFLIYDCPGLLGFDMKELGYGVVFASLGLLMFFIGLFMSVRQRTHRCFITLALILGLVICSVWRFQQYKAKVRRMGASVDVEYVFFAKDTPGIHAFIMVSEHIRPARWYEQASFPIGGSVEQEYEYRVPLKYIPD